MKQFQRYQLRTTDVSAARTFYGTLLGKDVADVEPLPPQAAERGAPAHWLGSIGVENVEHAVRSFVELGAVQLGPITPAFGGGQSALCRDPGGAVVALTSAGSAGPAAKPEVIWHQLYVKNAIQTAAAYGELFGWHLMEPKHHGEHGVHQEFAWQPGEAGIGSITDVAERPGVHSHWLFHFQIPALDRALVKVREAGHVVMGPMFIANGGRIAVCEDPQGAAFVLHEPA